MRSEVGGSSSWSSYQEEAAEFFRSLGLDAETNVRMHGARASHDVDVVVRGVFAGLPILWLVECKFWKRKIPKEKVLAFRSVVDDVGADRGLMIAEGGYQSGSFEAATNTNVINTSLDELRGQTEPYLRERALSDLLSRREELERRVHRLTISISIDEPKRIRRSRTLSGAGDVIELLGHLTLADTGMKHARQGSFPTVFGVDEIEGVEHKLRARSLPELLVAMDVRLDDLARLVDLAERNVAEGPDAHLLERS